MKYRQEEFLPLFDKIMRRSFMVDPQHPENEPVLHPEMEERIESEPYIPQDPYDIDASNVIHVVLVHDECAFNANDDQRSFWGQEGQQVRCSWIVCARKVCRNRGEGVVNNNLCKNSVCCSRLRRNRLARDLW